MPIEDYPVTEMPQRTPGRKRERGQILVLFELSFVVIVASAALVIDIGLLRNDRQVLVNTID